LDAAAGLVLAEDRPCTLVFRNSSPPSGSAKPAGVVFNFGPVKKTVPGGTGMGSASLNGTLAQFFSKIKVAESMR
jgi:hypothetical protein